MHSRFFNLGSDLRLVDEGPFVEIRVLATAVGWVSRLLLVPDGCSLVLINDGIFSLTLARAI